MSLNSKGRRKKQKPTAQSGIIENIPRPVERVLPGEVVTESEFQEYKNYVYDTMAKLNARMTTMTQEMRMMEDRLRQSPF